MQRAGGDSCPRKEEGYELSDEELEAVSGGWDHCSQEKYGCGMVGH